MTCGSMREFNPKVHNCLLDNCLLAKRIAGGIIKTKSNYNMTIKEITKHFHRRDEYVTGYIVAMVSRKI